MLEPYQDMDGGAVDGARCRVVIPVDRPRICAERCARRTQRRRQRAVTSLCRAADRYLGVAVIGDDDDDIMMWGDAWDMIAGRAGDFGDPYSWLRFWSKDSEDYEG